MQARRHHCIVILFSSCIVMLMSDAIESVGGQDFVADQVQTCLSTA